MDSMRNKLYPLTVALLLAVIVGMAWGRSAATTNRVGVITMPGGQAVTADMDGVTVFLDATTTNVAMQLPNAPPNGTDVTVKRVDLIPTNVAVVNAQGTDTIDTYGTSFSLGIPQGSPTSALRLTYNAGVWWVVGIGN